MELATEVTIPPGTHTLLATAIDGEHVVGYFFATVTFTVFGSTAYVVSPDRNAGKGEAYTRQPNGTWLGDSGRVIALHARV